MRNTSGHGRSSSRLGRDAPLFVPPVDRGSARVLANPSGDPVGVEVWSGTEWVALLGVTWCATSEPPSLACFAVVSLVLNKVLPSPAAVQAALPTPMRRT